MISVSLFAELFNEMLTRDAGFRIYKSVEDSQQLLKDQKEKEKEKQSEKEKNKQTEKEDVSEPPSVEQESKDKDGDGLKVLFQNFFINHACQVPRNLILELIKNRSIFETCILLFPA